MRVKDERRAKAKTDSKVLTNQTLVGFEEKGKGKHTGSGTPGASAHDANLISVEDYDYLDEDMDLQTPIKPTMTQLTQKR